MKLIILPTKRFGLGFQYRVELGPEVIQIDGEPIKPHDVVGEILGHRDGVGTRDALGSWRSSTQRCSYVGIAGLTERVSSIISKILQMHTPLNLFETSVLHLQYQRERGPEVMWMHAEQFLHLIAELPDVLGEMFISTSFSVRCPSPRECSYID